MTCIGLSRTLPPKSATAISAAATEPAPVGVEAGPDMSVRTPILTTSSETCALAALAAQAIAMARHRIVMCRIVTLPKSLELSLQPECPRRASVAIVAAAPLQNCRGRAGAAKVAGCQA